MSAFPKEVYYGITSDPKSWGMCCSEEMARECAEEHYIRRLKEERLFFYRTSLVLLGILCSEFIIAICVMIAHI